MERIKLAPLDSVFDTELYYLTVVRLGDKIPRAKTQRLYFALIVALFRCNDDGDILKPLVAGDTLKHQIAVHHRHDYVKDDRRNLTILAAQDLNSHFPVFRLNYRVLPGDNF